MRKVLMATIYAAFFAMMAGIVYFELHVQDECHTRGGELVRTLGGFQCATLVNK
jgi:hypothetical protein